MYMPCVHFFSIPLHSSLPLRIHSEVLLVSVPIPDFSMPYNVICFVCTVVAIAFGSLFNLTTKEFRPVDPARDKTLVS